MCKLGYKFTEEHKRKISHALRGRKFSEESRIKMSKAKKGKYFGENNPMFGKKRPDLIRYNKSKEHRISASLANLGKPKSQEHRDKLSIAHKISHNRPETIIKLRLNRMKQKMPTKMTSIELKIKEMLDGLHIPYEMHKSVMDITQPDFFIKPNVCIYCDGDYWHSLPIVIERDKRINETLKSGGYKTIRIRENQIHKDINYCKKMVLEVCDG